MIILRIGVAQSFVGCWGRMLIDHAGLYNWLLLLLNGMSENFFILSQNNNWNCMYLGFLRNRFCISIDQKIYKRRWTRDCGRCVYDCIIIIRALIHRAVLAVDLLCKIDFATLSHTYQFAIALCPLCVIKHSVFFFNNIWFRSFLCGRHRNESCVCL